MKKVFLKIYYYFTQFFKRKTFKNFEASLKDAVIDKEAKQILLMRKIKNEIELLWPNGRSKYIPLSYPQRIEIKTKVYSKFGCQMKMLHIKLNNNLHFV
jgi:hypothetical protein